MKSEDIQCKSQEADSSVCPACGAFNQCVMVTKGGAEKPDSCWCMQDAYRFDVVPELNLTSSLRCLCPKCLSLLSKASL